MPPVILAPYITRYHKVWCGTGKSAGSSLVRMSTDDLIVKLGSSDRSQHKGGTPQFPTIWCLGWSVRDCRRCVLHFSVEGHQGQQPAYRNGWACVVRRRTVIGLDS